MHDPEQDDNTEELQEPASEPVSSPDHDAAPAQPQSPLPQEAQDGPNGGPLGCCLGVTVGLLLSLSVAILSRLYATPLFNVLQGSLSLTVRIVMIVIAIVAAIAFGYFGWHIGTRVYREYELSPRQQARVERLQKQQRAKQRQRARQSR
jgi:hypothetical protein